MYEKQFTNQDAQFLLQGSFADLVSDQLTDRELLNQFKKIEKFPQDKKAIVKELIDAFILKTNLQQELAH